MIPVYIVAITLHWTQKYCKITISLSRTTALAHCHHLDFWTNFHQGILLNLLPTKITQDIFSIDLVEFVINYVDSSDILGCNITRRGCIFMA